MVPLVSTRKPLNSIGYTSASYSIYKLCDQKQQQREVFRCVGEHKNISQGQYAHRAQLALNISSQGKDAQ